MDRVIEARRAVIVLQNQETFIVDVTIRGDFCLQDKEAENEKISKYQNLSLEISRMWNTRLD